MSTETKTLVTGTDFVCIPTRDLDAARAFYGEVLGLPLAKTWGEENPVGAEFETGTLTLALVDSDRLRMEYRTHTHPIAFRVDDVHAARAELEASRDAATRAARRSHLNRVIEEVTLEKQADVAAEFDAVHTVERAQKVGSLQTIIDPHELRKTLASWLAD